MCGLLCQSAYRDKQFRLTLGVGLNISNREPTTCVDAAIEMEHQRLNLPGVPLPLSPEVGYSCHAAVPFEPGIEILLVPLYPMSPEALDPHRFLECPMSPESQSCCKQPLLVAAGAACRCGGGVRGHAGRADRAGLWTTGGELHCQLASHQPAGAASNQSPPLTTYMHTEIWQDVRGLIGRQHTRHEMEHFRQVD